MKVTKRDGRQEPLDIEKIHAATQFATNGLNVSQSELEAASHLMLFDGIKTSDIQKAMIVSAEGLISVEYPDYSYVAARLLLQSIYKDVTGGSIVYPSLRSYIEKGVAEQRLDPRLLDFDLVHLDAVIEQSRDLQFDYLGLQTIADRYLITERPKAGERSKIIELPQHLWMRVAMGLAINEGADKNLWASDFYDVLSNFEFLNSTPTLFNSGTLHPQLSSCYGNTVEDSITGIYETITECAHLSKYAGGIGTDWTRVRSAGDPIVGTNGKSSGVVPYLKVYNDTAVAVNQAGKRNGAFAAYLEPWHPDFPDFIDLKKESGDERRRTHDIFPASWIPDLFMKRVENDEMWSFFSPKDAPSLHELYGNSFTMHYEYLEREQPHLIRGQIRAKDLWRKMITSLFETGQPWNVFKDAHNLRNPQDHVGIIHNSNLCTEISENNSDDETFVCNLGSINAAKIGKIGNISAFFARVIPIAMRMLDNVIDINFYPSEKAKAYNLKSRSVGLGMMGYTEFLVMNDIDWESDDHLMVADALAESFSYHAISASCDLAKVRGAYKTFIGSKWDRGILPIDTAVSAVDIMGSDLMYAHDWDNLRERIKQYGMRNANCTAIAPTATIANIAGTTEGIAPIYARVTEKSNLSKTFTQIDPCLKHGKPHLCKEAFEIDQTWIIKAAAMRQRWIDQSQSVNLFADEKMTGPQLSKIYILAWKLGLKSTYYLKSKSTKIKKTETATIVTTEGLPEPEVVGAFCSGPSCESCQ